MTDIIDTEKEDAIRDIIADCDPIIEEIDFIFAVAIGDRKLIHDKNQARKLAEKWGYYFRKEEFDYDQI